MKTCNRCLQVLGRESFYAMASAKDGLQSCCIECRRAYNRANAEAIRERHRDYMVRTGRTDPEGHRHPRGTEVQVLSSGAVVREPNKLLRRYGMTEGDYETMLVAQGYRCSICFQTGAFNRRLAVDHCHETGVVCNLAIGLLRDEPLNALAAADYLATARSARGRVAWMDGEPS